MKQILVLLLLVASWQFAVAQTTALPCSATDIDTDDDGLIDICYLEGLNAIRNNLSGSGNQAQGCPSGGCNGYELMRDLDFLADAGYRSTSNKVIYTVDDYADSRDTGWQPIGNNTRPFRGTFKGNGYTLSNLMINRPASDYVGLFGFVADSEIVNVDLSHINVQGKHYVGRLSGYSDSSTISGSSASGRVIGDLYLGGLVGYSVDTTISDSSASGRVAGFYTEGYVTDSYGDGDVSLNTYSQSSRDSSTGGRVAGNRYLGGLVGYSVDTTISDSSASGRVAGNRYLGGLVGHSIDTAISDGFASGDVVGNRYLGGLVGQAERSDVTDSHAESDIEGYAIIGGLIGFNTKTSTLVRSRMTANVKGNGYEIGGVVGLNEGSIVHSTATGTVMGDYSVGGLVGFNRGDVRSSSFNRDHAAVSVSGFFAVGGLVGVNGGQGYFGKIINSSARGYIAGNTQVGGLVGMSAQGNISGNYVNTRVGGKKDVGGLIGVNWSSVIANRASGDIEGEENVGGLVGWSAQGNISGNYVNTRVGGKKDVGGLIGVNQSSVIANQASGNVGGEENVGGLVGWNKRAITNSIATNSVAGNSNVGGLIGLNEFNIVGNRASGEVRGEENVGGLVGLHAKGEISGSYVNAKVAGKKDVGGLIGVNEAEIADNRVGGEVRGEENVGGLIGRNKSGISDSTAANRVAGNNNVGGLIGVNEAKITDSRASGEVEGEENVGGLVGRNKGAIVNGAAAGRVEGNNNAGGLVGVNQSSIFASRTSGDVEGEENVGGLVGRNKGAIVNSAAAARIEGNNNVGGLVGLNESNITDNRASGDVGGKENVGGLVGWNKRTITNSYASNIVTGDNNVGGLVGINEHKIVIMNSYTSGSVTGDQNVGGLVGLHKGFIKNCYANGDLRGKENVGGLVGLIAPLDLGVDRIITSYKRGSIRGERNVGGLIGRGLGIRNSYWDTTTGGIAGDDDGIGKTAVELQTPTEAGSTATEIYYGWSSKNWDFGSAEQYPILKSTLNTLLPFQRIGLLRLDLQGDLILLPSFRTNVFNYRVIATNLSQLQLIPTAVSVNANIVVSSADGFSTSVVSGTTSTDVPLNTNGATTVAVEVSADNKNTVRYMLDVNNNNFNEGDRMILGHPHQVANEEVLTYEWTQESGIDLLSGVATDQALLDIKLPENLIGINSTATTAVFRLEISRGSTVVQSTDLLVTITKIDNSTIRLTSPPTLQALTLTAPQIDLSADSDGVGSLDVNSYRWQQRSGIGADWAEIEGETEATYRLPDDVPRYGEYQVRFSYTDGQGYSKSLVSDVIIVATDIDKDDDGLIEISNLQELNAIRYQPDGSGYRVDKDAAKSTEGCADGGCKGYELTRDLDFNDDESYRVGSGWQPIGTDRSPFNAIFHAHNNTISNLRINTAYAGNVGLFGVTGNEAEIDGIGLLNVDIIGSDSVGGLVGHKIGGTVRNSYVTGRVAGRGLYDVGGLVGWHQGGTITDSYTSSTVVATGTNSGGLVGDNDSAVITNSYTLGRVVANENSGGLVGRNTGTVTRSHATGTVEGGGAVGGLVGHNRGIITNSHTANAVTGGADVGGLAGWSSGDITNSYAIGAVAGNNTVGGFIGHNLRGTITNSYARSDVSGVNQYIGGFAGWNGAGTIINSYARGDVSGQEDVGGLVGVNNSPAGRVGKSYAVGRVVGMGDVGGLVGENRDGTITKSYWNITNNPTTTSTGGTPKTIVELQTPTAAGSTTTEIYYDWQSDDWDFASPTRYPLLRHAVGPDKAYPACGTTPTCGTLLSGQLPPVGLLGLTLSAGATLSPRFDVAIYNYHVNAKADAEFLRIQFTARDADATIKISTDGGFVADNASSDTRISLNADRATMITITVMAEYGITSEYKLYVNRMPKIVPIGPDTSVVIKEGKEHVIDVAVSDADISDVLILSLGAVSGSQDVVELVTTNVTVSANGSPERAPQSLGIKGLKADSTTLALTVRDEHEASATVLLTVTVEANEAPILTIKSLPSETISLGSTASLVVSVSDANFDVNDGVALEVVSSTSTVLVEPAGIVDIRGDTDKTFVLTGVQAGTAMISITATDGDGASTRTTFVLFIDAETTGTVSINSEDTWRLQATAEAEDANGIAEIKYQWYRREVGVTRLTKLVGETSRTYTIADDHVSRVAGTVYEISVSVTDRINRRSVLSAQHTVANETPTIGTLAPKEVEEGDTIDASEAVSDANHDDLNYQWEITDKADGSTVPADDSRLFVVPTDLVKPPAETTTLTLMLTVSDGRTDDVSTRVSVLVKRKNNGAAIPTVLIRDGQKLMPPVIDLSGDPDGAGISATYVWQRCSANCSTDGAWSDVGEASDSATEYEIQDGQAGYNFRLKVHYIDGQSYENVIFYNSGIRIRAKVFLENLLR